MPSLACSGIQEVMENKSNLRESVDYEKRNINCPLVSVPEKIILCLDTTQDSNCKPYTLKEEITCNPFQILKKVVSGFINNKQSFNSDHEFAVMSLEPSGVKWIHDFTKDTKTLIKAVGDLESVVLTEVEEINLTTVFKEVYKQVENLPRVTRNSVQFPPYVVRLILVYNSSHNMPKLENDDETFSVLTSSEYFHWDILYLHEAPTSENKCQAIYNMLLTFSLSSSYVFESSRDIVKVFNNMAKLLAHPLQRFKYPDSD